jgi:NIMA-interacting peptidyl-prolyl cis-trans isomerase 1
MPNMLQSALRRRGSVCLSVIFLCVVVSCAHAPPAVMAPAHAEAATKPQERPALLDVRVLLVAYTGAKGSAPGLQRTQPEALERARMLSSMAKTGDQLIGLIPSYSDRAGAAEDFGVVRVQTEQHAQPGPFDAAVVDAALALPVGGISDPLPTPEGYLVIERMKDPPPGPERIGAKHILIGYAGSPSPVPGVTRSQTEARALAAKILLEVRAPGADWNALAAQYTDEPAGKTSGGDLGKFGHGQMVPAFDKAAFALSVGQISDVVQSPFGYHIIQRYE